jgi:hypothetical protein
VLAPLREIVCSCCRKRNRGVTRLRTGSRARRAIAGIRQSAKLHRVILRFIRACLRRVLNLSFLAALSLLLGIGLGCVWKRTLRVQTCSHTLDHQANGRGSAHIQEY